MVSYIQQRPVDVPFDSLYLDPNNPRLGVDDPIGYSDPAALFEAGRQADLEKRIHRVYEVRELVEAIVGQGWLPIDNIIVATLPAFGDRHIVVEGNTRTVALRQIRQELFPAEERKLARLRANPKRYAPQHIREQEQRVAQLKRIILDTNQISVLRLDAGSPEEIATKLPRVLAVRHISGAKGWGNYAEDLWLLTRYDQLFTQEHGHSPSQWEPGLISKIADEASLSKTMARRRLVAASIFSAFKRDFEETLPDDAEFQPSDYYLFENIVRRPWLRQQFGISDDAMEMPEDRAQTLFTWVFKYPRSRDDSEENNNIFYRHENVVLWDQMRKYDEKNKTAFALRFDVTEPDSAPHMRDVEAEYRSHMANKKPTDIVGNLLAQLKKLDQITLETQGEFLKGQLAELRTQADKLLQIIAIVQA